MSPLTCQQIRRIDQLAVEQYAMPSIILMENAGANASRIIENHYSNLKGKVVAICCGPGNNGGDGFVVARHLHNAGYVIKIILSCPIEKLRGDGLTNYNIVKRMELPVLSIDDVDDVLSESVLVIDALLGTGFTGQVHSPIDYLINKINDSAKPIVSIDIPSGLDCYAGSPSKTTVKADLTVTFVDVKDAFLTVESEPYIGKIEVAGIGIPKELIEQVKEEHYG